ncbi:DUF2141 domain-containing protein [Bacteroides sp. ET71]|uniref:DUF2141 domain-containing protein n=1 Tax=Bacteroides sp. ET71 TaxID=2939421 RepID=UPI00201256BC|nr:DUF2141 domain-containing protein [Bacteroides sp. ET71]MCL1614980.1 DUF2141 domain-containing protein [Bacteroides sp. ET71]
MKTKAMILFAALFFIGSAARMQAQCLTLEVRDIDRPQGFLYVAFYSSPDNFLKKPLTGFRVEVKDKTVTVPCEGLPEGTYALALFQDLNGNGMLNTGSYGIPQEPTAFSNDAQGVMGPPSFESCSFTLRQDTTLTVHLR